MESFKQGFNKVDQDSEMTIMVEIRGGGRVIRKTNNMNPELKTAKR